MSLETFCRDKLAGLDATKRRRVLVPTARLPGLRLQRGERVLVDFSSNDALGLSHHPRVIEAATSAAQAFGTGALASRLVAGNHPLYAALEARLAQEKRAEAALVLSSGYVANLAVIPALVDAGDLILIDELAHACLYAGARLSAARVERFAHNDVSMAAAVLKRARGAHRRCLVVTESVFSMDGDRAPLLGLMHLANENDAWHLVDDAHGFLTSAQPVTSAVAHVMTGSLSKATASMGGTIVGPRVLVELLTSRARPLVYSTGLPPSAIASALAVLDVVADEPALRSMAHDKARAFCGALSLPVPESHIVPLVVGDEETALRLMQDLEMDGFWAVAIRPPTVPVGASRIRLSFSAGHSDDDVRALAAAVQQRWQR